MKKLIIEQTVNSPKVILDPDNSIYEISGESRPPDVREFYDQIVNWVDDFGLERSKTGNTAEPVRFNFNFGYFNSSSGKLILDICKILARLQSRGMNVSINWHYEKDDVDMMEVGQEISRIVRFPFDFTETDPG
jgi:SiaC family regulatory phosphoprotein